MDKREKYVVAVREPDEAVVGTAIVSTRGSGLSDVVGVGLDLGQAVLPGVREQHVDYEGEKEYVGAARDFELQSSCCFQ